MKKRIVTTLLAACMVLGLTACGGGNGGNAGNNGGSEDGEITLKFTYKQSASNDPVEKWFSEKGVIEAFEAAHPGVNIELAPISST